MYQHIGVKEHNFHHRSKKSCVLCGYEINRAHYEDRGNFCNVCTTECGKLASMWCGDPPVAPVRSENYNDHVDRFREEKYQKHLSKYFVRLENWELKREEHERATARFQRNLASA